MANESRIKLSDILVGAFLLRLIAMGLTAVVHSAAITFFEAFYWQNSIEQMLPFMLSLIVSLEIVELILIMYLLYRRQGPGARASVFISTRVKLFSRWASRAVVGRVR
jgi:hypothetical protein